MIDAAPARYQASSGPCTVSFGVEDAVAAIVDGRGSWGTGSQAADWVRDRLAEVWALAIPSTTEALAADLTATARAIPEELRDPDWGFGFSVAALLVRGASVTGCATGLYGISVFDGSRWRSLYRPAFLRDQLLEQGAISPEDLSRIDVPKLYTGQLFGETTDTLVQIGPFHLEGNTLVVAHADVLERLRAGEAAYAHGGSAAAIQASAVAAGLAANPVLTVRR